MNRTPHQQQYGQNQLEPKLKPQQKTQQRQQQSQQQQQQQRQQQSQQQQQQQPQQDRMNRQTQMNPNSMAYSSQQRAPPPKMPCSGGSAAPMSPTKGAYNQRMPPRATSAGIYMHVGYLCISIIQSLMPVPPEPMGPAGLYRSVETPNQLASQREPNGMYRSIQVPKTPRRADMSMTRRFVSFMRVHLLSRCSEVSNAEQHAGSEPAPTSWAIPTTPPGTKENGGCRPPVASESIHQSCSPKARGFLPYSCTRAC